MATRRYGITRGEQFSDITEAAGAATSSDNIELTADLGVNLTKEDVLLALDKFKIHILQGNWPPA